MSEQPQIKQSIFSNVDVGGFYPDIGNEIKFHLQS
jgi:hypothetical protein